MDNILEKSKHSCSIKKIYLTLIFLTTGLSAGTTFIIQINLAMAHNRTQIVNSLKQEGSEYQGILNDFLLQKNYRQISRTLSSLSSRDNFISSWISDENGVILFSDKSRQSGTLQSELLAYYGKSPGNDNMSSVYIHGDYILAHFPLHLGNSHGYIIPDKVGEFWLVYEIKTMRHNLYRQHIIEALTIAGIISLFFLLFFVYFYKSFIARLLVLMTSIKKFGAGDRSIVFNINGKDEIATLAQSLDQMATLININESDIKNNAQQIKKYVDTIDRYVITSKTNNKGIITYVSDAFSTISGYTKDEMIGRSHNIVRHPDTPKETFKTLWSTIKSGNIWEGELKNIKKDGGFYWVYARITPTFNEAGEIIEYTAVRQDITAQKKMEEIAITDELTRLYNRRYFNEKLTSEYNRSMRQRNPFGLIIFDVDFFKLYNDTYGHLYGDQVLEKIGTLLNEMFQRSGDFSFRLGGEEFGVIAQIDSIEDCNKICQKICSSIEGAAIEHSKNKASKYVTISIGMLFLKLASPEITTSDIYRLTDEALYQSKDEGRNRYTIKTL